MIYYVNFSVVYVDRYTVLVIMYYDRLLINPLFYGLATLTLRT